MEKIYPTIFTKTNNKKMQYLIYVPDLDVVSQGKTLENAFKMAKDIIAFTLIDMENDNVPIRKPSEINDIDVKKTPWHDGGFKGKIINEFVNLIPVDIYLYKLKLENKSVRRNVSLPKWLDEEATKANINVSALLQKCLKEKLSL